MHDNTQLFIPPKRTIEKKRENSTGQEAIFIKEGNSESISF